MGVRPARGAGVKTPALAARFLFVDCESRLVLLPRLRPCHRRVSRVVRLLTAVMLGASLVSVQRGVYCLMGLFICVLCKASDPSEWPSFNGSISEIYGLRTF